MDTAQWPQDIMVMKPMEEIVTTNTCQKPSLERKVRPQKEQALNCPRCNSTNTKFCYYNNYSLSQPRYFCKTCRRYWTEGGSLRNIPVGGGSRKNKRISSSLSSNSNSSNSSFSAENSIKKLPDLVNPTLMMIPRSQNPKNIQENQDLKLGFSNPRDFKTITQLIEVPNFETSEKLQNPSSTSSASSSHHHLSVLELLTAGINTTTTTSTTTSRDLNSFMPMPITSTSHDPNTTVYSSGFPMNLPHDQFKPSLTFSLDGLGSSNNYGSFHGVQETNGKLLFPFQGLKQVSNNTTNDHAQQSRDQRGADSTGYWNNGDIGGGSW